MNGYKTLLQEANDEYIVNKSRFIGSAAPVETPEQALAFLDQIRQQYKDATHNCYAYIIGKNAGIRFSQSLLIDEPLKFNRLAAKDGPLWALEQEARLPLYIDRLQGGCYFEGYDYDESLLDAYRNLLGDGNTVYSAYESQRVRRIRSGDTLCYAPHATRLTYAYPRSFYLTVSYRF